MAARTLPLLREEEALKTTRGRAHPNGRFQGNWRLTNPLPSHLLSEARGSKPGERNMVRFLTTQVPRHKVRAQSRCSINNCRMNERMRSPCFSPSSNPRSPLGKQISTSFLKHRHQQYILLQHAEHTGFCRLGAGWPSEVTRPMPLGDKVQGEEKANTKDTACASGHTVGQVPIGDCSERGEPNPTLSYCTWEALGSWLSTAPMGLNVPRSQVSAQHPPSTDPPPNSRYLSSMPGTGGEEMV